MSSRFPANHKNNSNDIGNRARHRNRHHNSFQSLHFMYVPATDIQGSVNYYTNVLDGEILWKAHAFRVWGARIKTSDIGPHILLVDHIKPQDPILIYRVENIDDVADGLQSRSWIHEKALEHL
jgi:hypothetical protein